MACLDQSKSRIRAPHDEMTEVAGDKVHRSDAADSGQFSLICDDAEKRIAAHTTKTPPVLQQTRNLQSYKSLFRD